VTLNSIVEECATVYTGLQREGRGVQDQDVGRSSCTLHTDAQRAEQILKNLLANAFKFTRQGSVTLEVHRPDEQMELQRSSLDYRNAIAFSVLDTGIGIEPSKFKDIFEAFQQEDGSIDRHYGGTGLGLTIARKFAHVLAVKSILQAKKAKAAASPWCYGELGACRNGRDVNAIGYAALKARAIELKTMPRTVMASSSPTTGKILGTRTKCC